MAQNLGGFVEANAVISSLYFKKPDVIGKPSYKQCGLPVSTLTFSSNDTSSKPATTKILYLIFLRIKFLFSKSTCYIIIIQITIFSHPNVMAKKILYLINWQEWRLRGRGWPITTEKYLQRLRGVWSHISYLHLIGLISSFTNGLNIRCKYSSRLGVAHAMIYTNKSLDIIEQ